MDIQEILFLRTQGRREQDLQLHDNKTFQCFLKLPAELQVEIIGAALENEYPGDQIVTPSGKSSCACTTDATPRLRKLKMSFYRMFCSSTHVKPFLPTTGIFYVNSTFYYEGVRKLFLGRTVVLTSLEAWRLLSTSELVGQMRKICIRDNNPGDSIFPRGSEDFDQAKNAHILHHLLLSPLLESLEIDIEPFNAGHFVCSKSIWIESFFDSFAIPSALLSSRCAGIGAFKLSKGQSSDFPHATLSPYAALFYELPSEAWNKLTLKWHAVAQSWRKVLSASPEDLAIWSSYNFPESCKTLNVWSTCPRKPLAIRNFNFWRQTGGEWPKECQWYHWALLSYLAHTYSVIRKEQGDNDANDQPQPLAMKHEITRNFSHNLLKYSTWEYRMNPPWARSFDLARLVPGTDPAFDEVWTQLFAVQSLKIKRCWSNRAIWFRAARVSEFVMYVPFTVYMLFRQRILGSERPLVIPDFCDVIFFLVFIFILVEYRHHDSALWRFVFD